MRITDIAGHSMLPDHAVYGFMDSVYVGGGELGYVGMAAFCLMMFSPFLILRADMSAMRSPMRRAALKGLILYMLMAGIDGAYNYIPMMAFYWFAFMIFLAGWPKSWSLNGMPASRRASAMDVDAAGSLAEI
jgi:hypothetical protein